MHLRSLYLCLFISLLAGSAWAQSKKDVKKYNIKSATETVTATINGKEITYVESVTTYNKEGKETSVTVNNPDGTLKKKESTTYNKEGKKTEKYEYKTKENAALTVNKRVSYKYNAQGDKSEEVHYEGNTTKVIKREVYEYNSQGERVLETTYDSEGKVIKKEVVAFNAKGLKSEKKTYDSRNKLITIKKYTYEFY
ncbi:MAG: hypothetical protein ACKOXB_08945 [Flavobacteriales bacterium]